MALKYWCCQVVNHGILGALAVPAIGWVAAPIIKAWVDGTPLNGLRGMWAFWKSAAVAPIPAWLGVVIAVGAVLIVIAINKRSKRRGDKTDLRIVILPTPPPRWGIGAMGNEPYLSLMVRAKLAHRAHESLEIVNVHLQGTACTAPFLPIVVAGAVRSACDDPLWGCVRFWRRRVKSYAAASSWSISLVMNTRASRLPFFLIQ